MSVYAILENNIVINKVVWDGETQWSPGDEYQIMEIGDKWCEIGTIYDDTSDEFVFPEQPE